MALPTKLSAGATGADLTTSLPRDWQFLLSRANSYRSMDEITLVQRDAPWFAGTLITHDGFAVDGVSGPGDPAVPAVAADIVGILCHAISTKAGPRMATVVTRDAEVTDAMLLYGSLDPTAVRQELSRHAIIVRQAVLPNVATGSFNPTVPGEVISGIPGTAVTVPPAAQPTYPKEPSFAPSTLEAAEPDMPAAGSPNPAPPTVPAVLTQRAGETDEQFRARQEEDQRLRAEEEQRRQAGTPSPPEAPRT